MRFGAENLVARWRNKADSQAVTVEAAQEMLPPLASGKSYADIVPCLETGDCGQQVRTLWELGEYYRNLRDSGTNLEMKVTSVTGDGSPYDIWITNTNEGVTDHVFSQVDEEGNIHAPDFQLRVLSALEKIGILSSAQLAELYNSQKYGFFNEEVMRTLSTTPVVREEKPSRLKSFGPIKLLRQAQNVQVSEGPVFNNFVETRNGSDWYVLYQSKLKDEKKSEKEFFQELTRQPEFGARFWPRVKWNIEQGNVLAMTDLNTQAADVPLVSLSASSEGQLPLTREKLDKILSQLKFAGVISAFDEEQLYLNHANSRTEAEAAQEYYDLWFSEKVSKDFEKVIPFLEEKKADSLIYWWRLADGLRSNKLRVEVFSLDGFCDIFLVPNVDSKKISRNARIYVFKNISEAGYLYPLNAQLEALSALGKSGVIPAHLEIEMSKWVKELHDSQDKKEEIGPIDEVPPPFGRSVEDPNSWKLKRRITLPVGAASWDKTEQLAIDRYDKLGKVRFVLGIPGTADLTDSELDQFCMAFAAASDNAIDLSLPIPRLRIDARGNIALVSYFRTDEMGLGENDSRKFMTSLVREYVKHLSSALDILAEL
jgi:hypothetical protein